MAQAMVEGLQVVILADDHAYYQKNREKRNMYILNERDLEMILMSDEIKDLPVAVVSVAGVFRGGKSFLLNYFIRYLSATPSARTDGSWQGEPGQRLTGFGWEPGCERNTTGILIWPHPFVIELPSGEKVAVLLMDTQGTFDEKSSTRDNSTIFALSTLLSSTQIYNIKENINESDLINLQFFSQYGKLTKENNNEKAFQVLQFLIRDWPYHFEYPYGLAGGNSFLKNKLKTTQSQNKELIDVREHIRSSFDEITCFLMPYPGVDVPKPSFKASPGKLLPEFKESLNELAHSIFSPEKLCLKRLYGQPVRSCELFNQFKTYVTMFNSDKLPQPKNILEAQSETGLLMAANSARVRFESSMAREAARSMPPADLIELHKQQMELALEYFENKHFFGSQQDIKNKQAEFKQELMDRLDELQKSNNAKTMTAVADGLAAYDAVMESLAQGQHLCVHAKDLELAHEEALLAAKRVFDGNRRVSAAGQTDPARLRLLEDCQTKYANNTRANDFTNKANISEILNKYLQQIMVLCNRDPKLSEEEFDGQHRIALARALDDFDSKRNRSNQYPQDAFKDKLKEDINYQYEQYKGINAKKDSRSLQLAIMTYYQRSLSVAELRNSCLHPDDLKRLHEAAMESALEVLRPGRSTSEGLSSTNPDEIILQNLMDRHFETMVDLNHSTNERAVEMAFKTYKMKFDSLSDYILYSVASWATANDYHNVAFSYARDAFYDKRRDGTHYFNDCYVSDLEAKCEHYYNPDKKNEADRTRTVVRTVETFSSLLRAINQIL